MTSHNGVSARGSARTRVKAVPPKIGTSGARLRQTRSRNARPRRPRSIHRSGRDREAERSSSRVTPKVSQTISRPTDRGLPFSLEHRLSVGHRVAEHRVFVAPVERRGRTGVPAQELCACRQLRHHEDLARIPRICDSNPCQACRTGLVWYSGVVLRAVRARPDRPQNARSPRTCGGS
jgi:hypothetical protein